MKERDVMKGRIRRGKKEVRNADGNEGYGK